MEGWISLHRKILESYLWKCEPFTRGQAWVDLLLLANYAYSFFYKRNIKVDVQRGQLARSEVELADRWSWSRTKVRKFLNDLEKEQQIIQQKTNITQIVTIVNYDFYQKKEQQDIQQKNSKKTAKEQQENTYNNVNNENNENKLIDKSINSEKFNFKTSFIDLGVDESIILDWLKVRKAKKASNTKTAFEAIKKEIEKSNLGANECIKKSVENSWAGFKAEWLNNINPKSGTIQGIKVESQKHYEEWK